MGENTMLESSELMFNRSRERAYLKNSIQVKIGEHTFPSIAQAALHHRVSPSHIRVLLKDGRSLNGLKVEKVKRNERTN